jgi:predicted unusual protein kinase regulating ubiquinone biosynthesis (AarF/ABC1/UbiB family)
MTGPVDNTTYHQLNVDLLQGKSKIGETAQSVDSQYQQNTASLAKRIILSIVTLGGFAIYHAILDSRHDATLRKLSRGTEAFYKDMNRLLDSAKTHDPLESVQCKMCDEEVRLSLNNDGSVTVTFADDSTETIKHPKDVLHRLERDVMQHSKLFERALVVDTILTKYEQRIDQGLADTTNAYNDMVALEHDAEQAYRLENQRGGYGEVNWGRANDLQMRAKELRPELAEAKNRYNELIADLFESRLGLSPEESKYIDRALGKQLATAVMNGEVDNAADARAFVNRNASDKHFTTIESAKIFAQFETARAVDKQRVTFQDQYYQPKNNPVLPQGQDKQVHDFVASIISNTNVITHEKDINKEALSDGQRLRTLFLENKELIGQLMFNRAQCKADPSTPSMLATVEPSIRQALEEQLDALIVKYDNKMQVLKNDVESVKTRIAEYQAQGFDLKNAEEDLQRVQNTYDKYAAEGKGQAQFLDDEIRTHQRKENQLRTALASSNIDDVSDDELNIIGVSKAFKNAFASEAEYEAFLDGGFLDDKREDIGFGLNFFGKMEARLDASFAQAATDLQNQVNSMLENVFPPAKAPKTFTVEEMKNANLGELIGSADQDTQMQLMKAVLQIYFREMPVMDQRAMLAAGTRYCVHGEDVSQGAKLGAILKGAGPVMQKMLQGLDASMFEGQLDFQLALSDMKDKLAPIAQPVIQAYLHDIVAKSNGEIRSIRVDKALGAASVAQALKCTIIKSDGTEVNCVVKILRPDATMRAQREKLVFEQAAREVGNGMVATFQGQFDSIMEELDLRKEAENVRLGNQVYDYSKKDYTDEKVAQSYGTFANVHSMKLVDGIEPSMNVMVLEQAQGSTLENYLKDIGAEGRRIAQEAKAQIQERGSENAPMIAKDASDQLTRLYDDAKTKYEALVNLAYMWTNEGLFAEGFYHGDIHKGNIMTDYSWKKSAEEVANDPNKGITLIDFGNASKLNSADRSSVIKVVAGTATGDAELFVTGFRALLSADGKAKFDAAGPELKEKLAEIFKKGTLNDTAARMSAALKLMQREHQIEVPGAIHNFLESQKRLQVAMDETLSTMNALARERKELIQPHVGAMNQNEQDDVQRSIDEANRYKPKTMMSCITDVVSQNLWSAVLSIGGARKANACYNRIRSELEAPVQDNQVQNDVIPPNAIMV